MTAFLTLLLLSLTLQAQINPAARRIATPATVVASSSTLNTSLIAYWKLDEASGTRVDSEPTGTPQDLTDNNTVTSNTGIISNAGQFTSANSEYLSRADSAELSTGDIDYTFAFWVLMDSKAATLNFVNKYTVTGNQREYSARYDQPTDRFTFLVSPDGIVATTVTASTFGTPSTATWYAIVVKHDATANIIGVSVNNGAFDTAAHTTGSFDSTAAFHVGASGTPAAFMNGRIDEGAFWKKVLSAAEITEWYNAGAGKTCCPF